jgi:glycosyltransferase involved in cell wall biosynthesis
MPGKNHKRKKKTAGTDRPTVSVCTPTFNRRPFIPYMIKCFLHQDYPADRMEWVIVDDGTDCVEDLIHAASIPGVKYIRLDAKVPLGEKRNIMHSHATGDILVYMDDDDYYPPCRVSHAVETLQRNPSALCVGSSILYIYFKHLERIVQFGPYGKSHATAGTFAFRKQLLEQTSYDDSAAIGEEKHFLKNYTIPFAQLDPMKVILVFSHEHNTFDKRRLLTGPPNKLVTTTSINPSRFIKEPNLLQFYVNDIGGLLQGYEPGRPEMKPDVLENIKRLEKERAGGQRHVLLQIGDRPPRSYAEAEVVGILNSQQSEIMALKAQLGARTREIHQLHVQIGERPTGGHKN